MYSYLTNSHNAIINKRKANIPDFISYTIRITPEVAVFKEQIDKAYEEIVHWRKNLFSLPTCKLGRNFTKELSTWLQHFNNDTEYQCVAVKTFMVLPALLLQKPSAKSKTKEHKALLEQRLYLWREKDITKLLKEGRTIQRRLMKSVQKPTVDTARVFSKLMFEGKVTAAVRMLCEQDSKGVLPMSDETLAQLKKKHPEPAGLEAETLLHGPIAEVDDSYYNGINGDMIFRAAKFTNGGAGPTQTDADFFKLILTHKNFKDEGQALRNEIALFARKIASKNLSPEILDAYVNCRLIPLDKCPGVRPIGIGETLRRIVGKTLSRVLKLDIQETCGSLQVCTGLKSGSEAAIHFIREQFKLDTSEAVILVDASNAFNSVNRAALLHNIQILCPEVAAIAINMYRASCSLFVCGTEISSSEGTTQGDNLAMSLFAIATLPVLRMLEQLQCVSQVWLADDAMGVGTLENLYTWWTTILCEGKKYGYYVNQIKSCLILKNADDLPNAKGIFKDCEISIKLDRQRHLGAVLGSDEYKDYYIRNLIDDWSKMMKKLVEFSKSQPHAAYSAFTHGVRHKVTYFMRTIEGLEKYLDPIDRIIDNDFIPSLFGCQVSPLERQIMSLPVKYGGLGIPVLTKLAVKEYSTSVKVTQQLVSTMEAQCSGIKPDDNSVRDKLSQILDERIEEYKKHQASLIEQCDKNTARLIEQAQESGSSSWLTCLPLQKHGFVMNKSAFRDSLRLRYGKDLSRLPSHCPCGETYSVTHALNCHKGGFVIMRHNEVRDFLAQHISTVCNDTEVEPTLQEIEGERFRLASTLTGEQAHPDIRARGFYRPGQHAYMDVKVINPNSESYKNMTMKKVYERAESSKKNAYNDRILHVEHGSFTPLIFSVTGGMGPQASTFIKLLCNKISYKHRQDYANVTNFIKCKFSFLIRKISLLCIRGSRTVCTKNNIMNNHDTDYMFACFESKLT